MLISKSFRRHVVALLFGSSLLAGCSSGPGTGFTRFWPDKKNNIDWQDDEALASKWQERMGESSKPGSSRTDPRAASTTRADDPNRFSLLRGFRRNDSSADDADTTESTPENRQITANRAGMFATSKRDPAPVDPFLMAERLDQQRQPVRSETAAPRTQVTSFTAAPGNTNRTASATSRGDATVPEWARDLAEPAPRTEVAASRDNLFAPGFDQSLNQLRPTATTPATNVADARRQPVNPFQEFEQRQRQTSSSTATGPVDQHPLQPSAGSPVAMTGVAPAPTTPAAPAKADANPSTPIGVPRDAFEDRRAWAALEVSQLMKHSRIQARAGQLSEALKTAVAAEQLAASAQVRFASNEQTPMQLIEWLKGTSTSAGSPEVKTAALFPAETPASVPSPPSANVANVHPIEAAAALPQWPGRARVMVTPAPASRPEPRTNQWATPAPSTPVASERSEAGFVEFANAKSQPAPSAPLPTWNSRTIDESHGVPPKAINATLVTRTIYHPENLRWSQLDESEATLIPPPPSSDAVASIEPVGASAETTTSTPAAPAPPTNASTTSSSDAENGETPLASGAATNRLALILLSLGALLAAIVYRRKHLPHSV